MDVRATTWECFWQPLHASSAAHAVSNLCSQGTYWKNPVVGPGVQAALDLFEGKWEELIGLPSRQSAADNPEVRNARTVCCKPR